MSCVSLVCAPTVHRHHVIRDNKLGEPRSLFPGQQHLARTGSVVLVAIPAYAAIVASSASATVSATVATLVSATAKTATLVSMNGSMKGLGNEGFLGEKVSPLFFSLPNRFLYCQPLA